ncbi:hypothetical protein NXW44_22060 [Phocaeicola vulgatus]|uniref:hypothetical protein n=1 Tax=Phocaeicola vulgatus TaxID=821 RepID=UPI002165EDF5|nr:hypothetical protein [Phocaeicola vulgatus]MCS2316828.1 hypothetical protein [Phocaeicola vulgatus]
MANYIQIRAKKASDVIGAGVISYALIGSFLLYKFHINLMEYTTPIILGFVVITVSFACTKRLFYHIMMENSNLLSFSMQKEFISVSSTINEPQSEPQSEPQKANNETQENEVGGQETLKSGQEIPKVDKKSGQETLKGGQEILNDTKNDTRNYTSKDTSYSYLDKYAMLQENIEKENIKRKVLIMEAVREYVTYTVAPYLKKEDVLILLENINCMAIGHTSSYKSIRSDLNNPLRSPDLRHLAWNIGERLGIPNRERAIFIKASFPFELRDATVEYLERNLRDVIPASIPIDRPAKGDYKFNSMKKTIAA